MPCIVIASRRSNLGRNVWVSCREHGKSEHSNLTKSANGKLQGEAGGNFVVTSTTQVSEQNTHPSTCFSSEVLEGHFTFWCWVPPCSPPFSTCSGQLLFSTPKQTSPLLSFLQENISSFTKSRCVHYKRVHPAHAHSHNMVKQGTAVLLWLLYCCCTAWF